MITASGSQQRLEALEAGADDFVTKPFDQNELLARVASLARLKRYHDTIERQAAELASWNAELERRVADGSPSSSAPAGSATSCPPSWPTLVVGDQELLASHRREIVVVFCDFHGFTAVRGDQRARGGDGGPRASTTGVVGERVHEHEGTLERFTGDGIMVFFNDPVPCHDAGRPRRPDGARRSSDEVQRLADTLATTRP